MINGNDFKPAWWLRNQHLQTCLPTLFSYRASSPVHWQELLLPDGDFLDLVWAGDKDWPIVILLHGMEGSVESHYIQTMIDYCVRNNRRACVMHFRGCSGRINRFPQSYHGSETKDLSFVIKTLHHRFPGTPISLVGFSLGGNVALHYLAENNPLPIDKAVIVSTPFEMNRTADALAPFYQKKIMQTMKQKVRQKIQQNYRMPVTLQQLKPIKTIRHFDALITAPLFNFRSVDQYYQLASCRPVLHKIQHPTLIIHAKDDPFVPADTIPGDSELSSQVILELSRKGGHNGFVNGQWLWSAKPWLPARIMKYLLD